MAQGIRQSQFTGSARLGKRLNRFPQGAPPTVRPFQILQLPPLKQALASRQVRFRYLGRRFAAPAPPVR